MLKNKKIILSVLLAVLVVGTQKSYARSVICHDSVKSWLNGLEIKTDLNQDFTPEQWIDITKMIVDELNSKGKTFSIDSEKKSSFGSFLVMSLRRESYGVEYRTKFTYTVSSKGVLTIRVTEHRPVERPMKECTEVIPGEGSSDTLREKYKSLLQDFVERVTKRAADF